MVESYRTGNKLTQSQADKRATDIAIAKHGFFYNQSDCPNNTGHKLAITDNIDFLFEVLSNTGPLYAFYSDNIAVGHLVVVTGVDLNTGTVYTNNPLTGAGEQTFEEFRDCYTLSKWSSRNKYKNFDLTDIYVVY